MEIERINQIKFLIDQFQKDRDARGYNQYDKLQTRWTLWYFLEYLKTRDEAALTDITADTLHAFQMDLYKRRARRRDGLALSSQLHVLVRLRMFFQWLVRRGHLLADPSTGIQLPKQKQHLPRGIMTPREVARVLAQPNADTVMGLRDKAILELLYSSAMRSDELLSLTLYDVNLSAGEALIRQGKGGKGRVVPVGDIAVKYLELYIKRSRPRILAGRPDPGWLFLGRGRKKLWNGSLNDIIERYAKRARLKKHVTAHGFRHTCATHLLRGRASLRHIQALLGHKSLESTQIYTRVEVGDLRRELKRCHPREQAR